ncbi:MAG: hypothetical protein QG637_503 [Chloroflexota bacterium]|nr:hypothetical protein [Chloroflexota bacterium]
MKTHSYVSAFILTLATAALALAQPAQRGPAACDGTGRGNAAGACNGVCAAVTNDTTQLALSNAAQVALLFQIDEERMARELYAAFGAKWGLQPFTNITQAEVRHEAVLRQIATRAGLTVPTAVAGRFDSVKVQGNYDSLLALGSESADAALRVGALVEEHDITDLNALIATTESTALKAVATAQKTASGHHLQAFVRVLAARGTTYVPQVLKADEYQAILAADSRGMGRGRGQGNGQCNGQGQGQGRGRGKGQGWGNCPARG